MELTPRTPHALRRTLAVLLTIAAATALAACSDEANQQQEGATGDSSTESGSSSGGSSGGSSGDTSMQETMMEETTAEMVGEGEVTVGGFVIDSPGVPESSIPEVSVQPEEAQAYLDDVQPIVEGTVLNISSLVEPEVGIQDGNLSLDLNTESLDEAAASVNDGVDQLREVQPPEGLEPINDELIAAYEEAAPAYEDIVSAAQDGDPEQLANVVQESLQQVEAFNEEVDSVLNDLQEAAGNSQQ